MAEANLAYPAETGGVLLGYWAQGGADAVVTHIVGPGPQATHGRNSFAPDSLHQIAQIARIYEETRHGVDYLGDWHTHPGATGSPSAKDRATLRRIATAKAARAPRPLMLILGFGPQWKPVGWQGRIHSRRLLRRQLRMDPVQVRIAPEPVA